MKRMTCFLGACLVLALVCAPATAQPAIENGSFEADTKYEEWPHYHQSLEITGWTHTGDGWGINESDGPFHAAANGAIPDGTQVVFMQGWGTQTLSQTPSGFKEGWEYNLSFYVNARPSGPNAVNLQVSLGDAVIGAQTTYETADPYHFVEIPFTYAADTMGSGVLTFTSSWSEEADVTCLLDDVQLTPITEYTVFRFDCDTEGFGETHGLTLDSIPGYMIVSPTEEGDPYTSVAVDVTGGLFTEFGMAVEVQNAPSEAEIPCALFYDSDAGTNHVAFTLVEGANIVRLDLSEATGWDSSVTGIRLDLPDADVTDYVAAGTVFLVDIIAFTDKPDYAPADDEWTLNNDCDEDGLSNDAEDEWGTDPYLADTDGDGAPDGLEVEHGTSPLDPQETVTVPVVNYLGLALTALILAASALVLVSRRRTVTE